jgi:hypothetical protein
MQLPGMPEAIPAMPEMAAELERSWRCRRWAEVAVVYEEMHQDDAGAVIRSRARSYRFLDDTATPFATTELEVLAYNEPIDESLFAD